MAPFPAVQVADIAQTALELVQAAPDSDEEAVKSQLFQLVQVREFVLLRLLITS